jgi:hypothetical protein
VVAIGTVHITCLPALSAAIDIQAWSGIGLLMWTKSTSGSASTSSYEEAMPRVARGRRGVGVVYRQVGE